MKNIYNLKSFYTHLLKNKLYTSIEIFGFSVSLIFVFFIAIYTVQELSTDKFQTKADRIFIVGHQDEPVTGAAIAYKLKERYPEIEKVCPVVVYDYNGDTPISSADRKLNASILFADSTFFDLFSFKLLRGNPTDALVSMNSAVISQSFAKKFFGTDDVLGKTIQVGDSTTVTISGVVEDLRNSALPESDIILPWRLVTKFNYTLDVNELHNATGVIAFVLTHEGVDFRLKANEIRDWYKTFFWFYERGIVKEVKIESLTDFYMTGWGNGYPLRSGDRDFILILMFVGILILIFAILNYINLTVAQSGYRYKEMAMRRLLGSSRKELMFRLMLESILLVFISVFISVLLTLSGKAFINDLLGANLDFSLLYSPLWIAIQLGLVLFVGCLSGWLPAFIISAVEPIEIVRGSFRRKTKMVFSKIFIVFQNLITIVMLSASLIMILQINHLQDAPLGYNTKKLYEVRVGGIMNKDQIQTFRNELRALPSVKRVGFTIGSPTGGSNNLSAHYETGGEVKTIGFQQYKMDKECFEMLGLKMLRSNQISGDGDFINTEALRQMNLPEDANSFTINKDMKINIAGIISDFHERNILGRVPPISFKFLKPNETGWSVIVEIQGNPIKAQKEIADIFEQIAGVTINAYFMDKQIENTFQSQIRLAKIISVFTGIAILISILGLIAMSTYFIQQKEREIAIRKVFGSTNQGILIQLVRTFLMYVLIAFIIATPIAYYFMSDWLDAYSYRIDLSAWIFLVVGFFSALVSFVVVVFQSWRASNSNPVKNLKSE